jgi:hypothetical protein
VILLELRRRRERSDRRRGTEQVGEDDGGIELALLNRAEDAGEHLVRVGTARGAVTTTDFAGDDGGAQRLFRTPVGRVDRRVEQKREDRRVFDCEMRSEALSDAATARLIDESIEPILEMAAGDGDAVGGHGAPPPAVTNPQSLLEDGLHLWSKPVLGMVAHQRSTTSQQMREARLMDRLCEAAIRRPAVADQHAVKVRAQHGGRFFEAAPWLDGVHGRVWRGEAPQPLQVRVHFPSGLVGADDGTAANGGTQRGIRRFGLARRPADRVHEAATGDREAEALPHQRGNLPERQAQLFVEHDRERHGLRTQLRRGGADRVRRLERMPSLDAAPAGVTEADGDVKGADDRAHDRQIFLVLRRVTLEREPAAAIRATRRQRSVVGLIDVGRWRAMCLASIGRARFSAGAAWRALRQPARKRCGLAVQGSAGRIQLVFEPFDLLTQPVAFTTISIPFLLRSFALPAQAFILALLPFELGDQVLSGCGAPARSHAPVMPRFNEEYKRKLRRSRRSDAGSQVTTR